MKPASGPLDEIWRRMTIWLQRSGPESDIVLSSRVRLARNLRKYAYPQRASDVERTKVYAEVAAAVHSITEMHPVCEWNVETLSLGDRRLLLERHLASPHLLSGDGARGVFCRSDESLALLVNEEDHIRIQSLSSGLELNQALAQAIALDQALEERLEFAANPRCGYLTACPTNVGTGLRASCLMHLPALSLAGEMKKMQRAVGELGMTVRGWFGEGTSSLGNFFQLSNQKTLGMTESESCEGLMRVARRVLGLEREARQKVLETEEGRDRLLDRMGRSLGILTHSRWLNAEQAMGCVSDLRLGASLGIVSPPPASLDRLVLFAQGEHLRRLLGEEWVEGKEPRSRARWVRQEVQAWGPIWTGEEGR